MSGYYYYGTSQTPQNKAVEFDATSTLTLWAPASGKSVTITGLTIQNHGAGAGTFTLFRGTTNGAPTKIAQFSIGASATVKPLDDVLDLNVVDQTLYGRPSSSSTAGQFVFLTGFEK